MWGQPPPAVRRVKTRLSLSCVPESEFTLFHIDFPSAKPHALSFQTKSLLHRRIATKLNLSACAEHALPWQSKSAMQNSRHQPCPSGKSRSPRYRSIGRDLAFGNAPYDSLDSQPQVCRRIRRLDARRLRARRSCCSHSRHALPARSFVSHLHNAIHPNRISQSDPSKTKIHNTTPCSKGRCPTRLMVATEMPLPIRNKVAVNPIFASFTATG
jgi:hypothetical protein